MRAGAAGSTSGRGGEPLGDCVSKKLAQSIEKELHAHKQENEDFPVSSELWWSVVLVGGEGDEVGRRRSRS